MILVADAAPVIFLAKINQLALLSTPFGSRLIIASVVHDEILAPDIPPGEERILAPFVSRCTVIEVREPKHFAGGLSFADNCVLTLAHGEHADIILSDDRLLRKLAVIDGFRVIGTIGVLSRAKGKSLLTSDEALRLLDQLVETENFRISTRVYQAARKALEQSESS